MDKRDEEILDILEEDGRASFTHVADEIGVSEGTVRNRVKNMLEEEVIEKFTVKKGSRGSKAVVMIRLRTGKDIEKVLKKFPEKINLMEVTGEYDLIMEIERSSNQEINELLDDIRRIDGVKSTETYMVLKERS